MIATREKLAAGRKRMEKATKKHTIIRLALDQLRTPARLTEWSVHALVDMARQEHAALVGTGSGSCRHGRQARVRRRAPVGRDGVRRRRQEVAGRLGQCGDVPLGGDNFGGDGLRGAKVVDGDPGGWSWSGGRDDLLREGECASVEAGDEEGRG